jgi:hypothetical protein
MRYVIPVLAFLLCHEAAAQMFKCTDKAGKVTYSGTKCADLGLKDVGEVKDRIQVTPAPPESAAPPPPSGARVQSDDQAKPAAAAEPPKEPERRCFTTRNAKGATVTRCNDKPDED